MDTLIRSFLFTLSLLLEWHLGILLYRLVLERSIVESEWVVELGIYCEEMGLRS